MKAQPFLIVLFLAASALGASAQTTPTPAAATPSPPPVPDNVRVLYDEVVGTVGGHTLHADVALPKDLPATPLPAVIIVHGGGGTYQNSRLKMFLAAHGFVSASIDYRDRDEAKWPASIEDCKLGVRWLRANAAKYHVDPDHIGCFGASSGGWLCNCLGTMGDEAVDESGGYPGVSSQVQAVGQMNGPSDRLARQPGNADREYSHEEFVERRAGSPIYHVKPGLPPFLIMHGDKDDIVPYGQSAAFVAVLQKANVSVKFVSIPGGGHNLDLPPSNRDDRWNDALVFFQETLGRKADAR